MVNRITAIIIIVVAGVGIAAALMTTRPWKRSRAVDSGEAEKIAATSESARKGVKRIDAGQNRQVMDKARRLDQEGRPSELAQGSPSLEAIERATRANKYVFIFFSRSDETGSTGSMLEVFRSATARMVDKAIALEVDTGDPAERAIVDRFGVSRAPMPLVLAVAPNGAITGGFPQTFAEAQLLEAFASPCEEKALKSLQDRKLVLVCVQNGATKMNEDAMKGVQDFKADPNFGPSAEIVMLDPSDPAESGFLKALGVAPETRAAVTVCLLPPGNAVARFTGETRKETIVAALTSSKGCGPGGCGPGGCGQ